MEKLENILKENNTVYLCYIAFPIDDMDDLIENPNLSDWDFEENYIKKIIKSKTIPIGAIYFNNKKVKLRTVKFLMA